MIHVIATIDIAAGKRPEFLAAFRRLVPLVHAESGCIEYGPTIDVSTAMAAAPPRENSVIVVEKWESLDALQAHLAAPHMIAFREANGHLIEKTAIQIVEPA